MKQKWKTNAIAVIVFWFILYLFARF